MNMLRSVSLLALAFSALSAHAAELVVDGGFEQATPGFYAPGSSFSGGAWTVDIATVGFDPFTAVENDAIYSISGNSVFFGDTTIFQSLSTVAGATYTLTFDAYSFDGSDPTDTTALLVRFGSASRAADVPFQRTPGSFGGTARSTSFSFDFTATGTTTLLSLGTTGGIRARFELDNVSVQGIAPGAVPGPAAALPFALMAMRRRKKA